MKGFPINGLLQANDLKTVQKAIDDIFDQFNKLKSLKEQYPVGRLTQLIEAISKDVFERMCKILEDVHLMTMPINELIDLNLIYTSVFETFNQRYKNFSDTLYKSIYSIPKQHSSKIKQKQPEFQHNNLKKRLDDILKTRTDHEKLIEIIQHIYIGGEQTKGEEIESTKSLTEIEDSYKEFLSINVLDLSQDGSKKWHTVVETYNQWIDRVEVQITTQLRELLNQAGENANQLYKIFQKFNALLSRPRIKSAIQDYQTNILQAIKFDIKILKDVIMQ
jgi:dynein heavy chain 1, cytosolic